MSDEETTTQTESHVAYSYRLDSRDFQRIMRHLHTVKKFKNGTTEQKWLEDAFKEKLNNDGSEIDDYEQRDRNIFFKLSALLNKAVEERVASLKNAKLSYNKKKWFLEAIFEKVNREEQELNRSTQIASDGTILPKLSKKSSDRYTHLSSI